MTILPRYLSSQILPLAVAALLPSTTTLAQCIGDITSDGRVDGQDLGALLNAWGPANSSTVGSDLNLDGVVNGADMAALLLAWGSCPPVDGVPTWALLLERSPDPVVVTDLALRQAIEATGLAWRVLEPSTQLELLLVPAGTYQVGCPESCYSNDPPIRLVTLTKPYYLGRYEVTQAQWHARMGSNPSYFQGSSNSASRPVEQVSWDDLQAFLAQTGFRLPTEAEWETACRAGTTSRFGNGSSDPADLEMFAWLWPNAGGVTHEVGAKLPNALGFHDMHGNVWEWVSDLNGPVSNEPQVDPTGAPECYSPNLCGHVRRGGGVGFDINDPIPVWGRPGDGTGPYDYPSGDRGFRVARNP